jgi:hypothetical protein
MPQAPPNERRVRDSNPWCPKARQIISLLLSAAQPSLERSLKILSAGDPLHFSPPVSSLS